MKITLAQQLLESARRLIEAADRTASPALTQGMLETLVWAQQNEGYVVAGHDLARDGTRYFFSAGSVRALGSRGLAELKISPDGDVAATLTDAGRAHDVLAGPVGDRLVSVDGGEPVSLREFAKLNEGLDLFRYVRLKVDDTIREGGGAAARFKVKRVASPEERSAVALKWERFPLAEAARNHGVVARSGRYEISAHRSRLGDEGRRYYAIDFTAIEVLDNSVPGKRKYRDIELPRNIRSNLKRIMEFISDLDSKTATEASTRKAWDQSVLPVSQDEMNGMDDDERRALLYEELCRAGDLLEAVADAFRNDLGVDRDAVDQAAQDVIQLAKRLNSP